MLEIHTHTTTIAKRRIKNSNLQNHKPNPIHYKPYIMKKILINRNQKGKATYTVLSSVFQIHLIGANTKTANGFEFFGLLKNVGCQECFASDSYGVNVFDFF
jgi:hypothetical protein